MSDSEWKGKYKGWNWTWVSMTKVVVSNVSSLILMSPPSFLILAEKVSLLEVTGSGTRSWNETIFQSTCTFTKCT